LSKGDAALHEAIQTAWPLDAEAAFGVLPTRLSLHADPRFSGKGITIALVDAGFYPHPDLVQPRNRVRVWVDATHDPLSVFHFEPEEVPTWPDWNGVRDWQWRGTMTSTVAAGNGFLSHGLYSGLAYAAELVLIQVRDCFGHISSASIHRALTWILQRGAELGTRVVSLSVSGDPVSPLAGNAVDEAVAALVDAGISVVAAAGNDGQRTLLPPATAPQALTVGGIDDKNTLSHEELALWHSNYGSASNEVLKPDLVAPSIWVAAPVLPNTSVAEEARDLFVRRMQMDPVASGRITDLKLITPHYQHVEGTSFAAPIVASCIACLLEANPALTPLIVRDVLKTLPTLFPVPIANVRARALSALGERWRVHWQSGIAGKPACKSLHIRLPRASGSGCMIMTLLACKYWEAGMTGGGQELWPPPWNRDTGGRCQCLCLPGDIHTSFWWTADAGSTTPITPTRRPTVSET